MKHQEKKNKIVYPLSTLWQRLVHWMERVKEI